MTTLVEFLLACIAEDESPEGFGGPPRDPDDRSSNYDLSYMDSIDRRMLAECEAKRRIIELHTPEERTVHHLGARPPEPAESTVSECPKCVETGAGGWDLLMDSSETAPCETLRLLALPYADWPGYREEWR